MIGVTKVEHLFKLAENSLGQNREVGKLPV